MLPAPSWYYSGDLLTVEYRTDPDEIMLFGSPTEELASLPVREGIGGYYRQAGVVWNGGTTLWTG